MSGAGGQFTEGIICGSEQRQVVTFQCASDTGLLNKAKEGAQLVGLYDLVNDITGWRHHDGVDGMDDAVGGYLVEIGDLRALDGHSVVVWVNVESDFLAVQRGNLELVRCVALHNLTLYHVILENVCKCCDVISE